MSSSPTNESSLLPGKPTLEGIEEVPWSELYHAYGPATDVPDQLRALFSDDAETRNSVLYTLYGNIFHQGSVYPATLAAVPFLREALRYQETPDRQHLMMFLAHLAVGFPEDVTVQGWSVPKLLQVMNPFHPRKQLFDLEDDDDYYDDEDELDTSWYEITRACYAEVAVGCPVYQALLSVDDERVRIAAGYLLAWFPAQGWSAGPTLLDLAQDKETPRLTRTGCLMCLSHLATGKLRESYLEYCRRIVKKLTSSETEGKRVPALGAAACFGILRDHLLKENPKVPRAVRELAEACLRDGVTFPGATDIYPDDSDGFPWGVLPQHVQGAIQCLMALSRKQKKSTTPGEGESFDFHELLFVLRESNERGEAVRLAKLLLDHAFGNEQIMTFREAPDHSIISEDWNEEQRQVMLALAECKAAWPEIGFHVQSALRLDFEPVHEDVVHAIQDVSPTKEPGEEVAASSGKPTDQEVMEAVRRLLKLYSASDHTIDRELKQFERYRPYSGVAVPRLIELFQNNHGKKKKAAAWALGRLGPVARPAAPILFKHFSNMEIARLALMDIGMDDVQPLLDLMKHPDKEMAEEARWVFGGMKDVPEETVLAMLDDVDREMRLTAVLRLRGSDSPAILHRFLNLLDDPDDEVRSQARYGLSDAKDQVIPIVLEAYEDASPVKRRLLAEVLRDLHQHVQPHVDAICETLEKEEDTQAQASLVLSLRSVNPVSPGMVTALGNITRGEGDRAVKEQCLATFGRLALTGEEAIGQEVLRILQEEEDPFIRRTAVNVLRNCREPASSILETLRGVLSSSTKLALKAVWTLFFRGEEGVKVIRQQLPEIADVRVKAEMVWALGLAGDSDSASLLENVEDPLLLSVMAWSREVTSKA